VNNKETLTQNLFILNSCIAS